MTLQEINKMIEGIGLPYAYYEFANGTAEAPPFVCFYYTGDNDFIADNSNYQHIERLIVELYADNKDFSNEMKVEDALRSHGIVWEKSETFIEDEHLYMTQYESEVIIHEQS